MLQPATTVGALPTSLYAAQQGGATGCRPRGPHWDPILRVSCRGGLKHPRDLAVAFPMGDGHLTSVGLCSLAGDN